MRGFEEYIHLAHDELTNTSFVDWFRLERAVFHHLDYPDPDGMRHLAYKFEETGQAFLNAANFLRTAAKLFVQEEENR